MRLFIDRYHRREVCFSGIEVIRNSGVIEQKRQNRKKKKKKKKGAVKDHKND